MREAPFLSIGDTGGFGRRHETVDPLRLGVEEHPLRTGEDDGQGFGALQIGRDDFGVRREPTASGVLLVGRTVSPSALRPAATWRPTLPLAPNTTVTMAAA